jgi:hypothetical protein
MEKKRNYLPKAKYKQRGEEKWRRRETKPEKKNEPHGGRGGFI